MLINVKSFMDKDLTNPTNNDFIPKEEKTSETDAANDFIPEGQKSPRLLNPTILTQLENSDSCQIGNLVVQRLFRHNEGQGGEFFSILDMDSGKERTGIELSQIAEIRDEADLRKIFEE